MLSEEKTLIIFDTNTLRSTEDDQVTYGSFQFSFAYDQIEKFIKDNGLENLVKIAIPRIVIEEIKNQKTNQYSTDVEIFKEIYDRLSALPHINHESIEPVMSNFDCESHIGHLAEQFLVERKILVIELPPDEKFKACFQRIVERALKTQPPFKKSNKYSDSGFKDTLIWESILNFEIIKDFDKIILMTGDTGLNNDACKKEFAEKIERFLSFQQSPVFVLEGIKSDYEEFIKNYQFVNFAKSDYFNSYLTQELSGKKFLLEENQRYAISEFVILNSCESVEVDPEYDESGEANSEWRVVTSKIKIVAVKNGSPTETIVTSRTYVDENKEIDTVSFVPELIS